MEFLNVFASVDKDEDLVIHEADLDAYAADMKYEKAFTMKWLRLFDQDKDGKFTFSDFCETLGLDEKIYEEKLREARKTVAQRQQRQPADSDRASRRTNRLPRAAASKPVEQEVKENIEPQQSKKVRVAPPRQEEADVSEDVVKPQQSKQVKVAPPKQDEADVAEDVVKPQQSKKVRVAPPKQEEADVTEEVVQPQTSMKARAGVSSKSSPEEVRIEFGDDDPSSINVEFSDMESNDLEEVKRLLAKTGTEWRRSADDKNSAKFERQMMNELDKKLGKTWQCQVNPVLSYKEVNYLEGGMAVLITPQQNKRVMVWRPQPAGGMCCAS